MPHISAIHTVAHAADGMLAVTVRCCNDCNTDSVLTLQDLSQPAEQLDAAIARHQAKVEARHAAKQAAVEHFARWMTLADKGCGCK